MFRKFLYRLLGVLFILQSVFMFIQSRSQNPMLSKISLVEGIIFLLIFPWSWAFSRLSSVTFAITGISLILYKGNFAFLTPYYKFLIFVPAVMGVLMLLVIYLKKAQS